MLISCSTMYSVITKKNKYFLFAFIYPITVGAPLLSIPFAINAAEYHFTNSFFNHKNICHKVDNKCHKLVLIQSHQFCYYELEEKAFSCEKNMTNWRIKSNNLVFSKKVKTTH